MEETVLTIVINIGNKDALTPGSRPATAATCPPCPPCPPCSGQMPIGPPPKPPQPSEDIPQPSEDIPQPAEDIPQPAEDIPEPAEDIPEPSEDIPQPAEDIPEPAEDIPQPAEDIPQPAEDIPQPAEDIPEPAEDIPQPAEDIPQPAEDIPQPAEDIQEPAEDISQPAEDIPQPAEDIPQPAEDIPQPAEDIPQPAEDIPEPAEDIPQPAEDIPQPAEDIPQPAEDIPQPAEDIPQPAEDIPQPAEDIPEPAEDIPQPAEDIPQPAEETLPEMPVTVREPLDPSAVGEPKVVNYEDVVQAYEVVKDNVVRTPCTKSRIGDSLGVNLYFKKEFMQYTGSFKERGATNALTNMKIKEPSKKGVVAASAGNHAYAMSYVGSKQGVPITVVMPETAPLMKVEGCRELNANVLVVGKNLAEAKEYALNYGAENDLYYINGYDDPDVIAGAGTCFMEILEDVPDVDAVVVPIGGGGLLGGACAYLKNLPDRNPPLVIAVESEKCPGFSTAMQRGEPTKTELEPTIAEGLAVQVVGRNAFATTMGRVDTAVTVEEIYIGMAMVKLMEIEKAVVEGSGCVGLAALMCGKLDHLKGKTVVVVLSGGNVDMSTLGRCLTRSLAADGRLVSFAVFLPDKSTSLPELFEVLKEVGANVLELKEERAFIRNNFWEVEMFITCETTGMEMANNLENTLKEKYGDKFVLHGSPLKI